MDRGGGDGRNEFKQLVVEQIREEFGLGFRSDLRNAERGALSLVGRG